MMRRRPLLTALLVAVAPLAGAAPPAVNLTVEWRTVSTASDERRESGVRSGGWQVDTRSGVSGQASVTWGRQARQADQQFDGQVTVLNGGRASLSLRRTAAITHWRWLASVDPAAAAASGASAASGRSGLPPGVQLTWVPDTQWIDRGQGLSVRPRWPGGGAPVELELDADVEPAGLPGTAYDPDGQVVARSARVRTALSVPLDTWTPIARNANPTREQHRGSWSSGDSRSDEAFELQIRVRRP